MYKGFFYFLEEQRIMKWFQDCLAGLDDVFILNDPDETTDLVW